MAATGLVIGWVAIMEPLNGYVFALDGILIGAGDLPYLARSMVISAAMFAAACWALIATGASLSWLWAAIVGLMVTRAVFLWLRWRTDHWAVLGAISAG